MTSRETIAAVVVSKDTRETTLQCVRSVLAHGTAEGCDVRVVVVDNASSDGTVAALEGEFADRVDVVALARNVGFGAACNLGASRVPGAAWVLLLNADTELTSGALDALVRVMRARPAAAVAGPRFTYPDGREQPSLRGHPTPAALLYQHTAARFLRIGRTAYSRYKDTYSARHETAADAYGARHETATEGESRRFCAWHRTCQVTLGACMLVRGDVFRALGGFDERYFLYFEEADLQRRAQDRGGEVIHVPEALVLHEGAASSDRDRERALTWYLQSLFRYVDRFHGRATGLVYRVVFKPLFLVKMLTDAVRDALVLVFRGRREKRAELALAARFLVRGMWTFLFA